MDEFRTRLQSINLPPWRIDAVSKELEAISNGAVDHTTDGIEQLLGRPATTLTRFIEDYASLFSD